MKAESSIQIEKLKQISDYLHNERERQAISLEEVAVKTFIPLRLLQALEQGQVERLPEPVFVQGFIRRYADALGLDGMALAKTFPVEPPPAAPHSPEPESLKAESAIEKLSGEIVASVVSPPHSPTSRTRVPLPYVVSGSVAVVLLAAGAFSLFNRPQTAGNSVTSQEGTIAPSTTPNPQTSIEPTPSDAQSQPSLTAPSEASPTLAPEPSAQELPIDGPVEVAIDLRDGDSWMEVVVDGKTEFEGTLKKGTQRTWTAEKNILLISGNAGAVYVTYNQGEEKKLGNLGEVKEVTFPPKSEALSQTN
ncbi:RodZ domain-containing protein [Leptothermofonsia sp. ETS-13]|uniref:RodZ domain-containing protein n=1 Tax=Leptothermofonsia sp. ETS-13 TaxID=3035696 RepID=UPI003BA18A3A